MLKNLLLLGMCCVSLYCRVSVHAKWNQPNIVLILADDLGYNDVSIHGSNNIPTPNIDALHAHGISLGRYYVAPMCSPSRSSLMTGKYPSSVGMQRFVIVSDQPYGLGLDEKILPEYLSEAGYRTKMVGKWHLGFFERGYTPTSRGFDEFFGYWGPYIDYFNHSLTQPPYVSGYDIRKNRDIHWDTIGQYATDLFTDKAVEMIEEHNKKQPLFLYVSHLAPHAGNENDPLQARDEDLPQFEYIKDENRKKYAAMVARLDISVGRIIQALDRKGMLDDTIVLFMADNGAPVTGLHANYGSNYPFKGQKDSPWEGASRSAAAIWSRRLRKRQRISNELYHISDWLPTFCHLAGVSERHLSTSLDGKNIWRSLSDDKQSPRRDVLINVDNDEPYSSYIRGNYKIVIGSRSNGIYDTWLSSNFDSEENINFRENYVDRVVNSMVGRALCRFSKVTPKRMRDLRTAAKITCNGKQPARHGPSVCDPYKSPCLFNIVQDPCETTNIAEKEPDEYRSMLQAAGHYIRIAEPTRNQPGDPRSDPKFHNNTWTNWFDEF